jgi:predicted phage baseplate assembly protein
MSDVWWGKESSEGARAKTKGTNPQEMMSASRQNVRAELRSRIQTFTPEWTSLGPGDAGIALIQLFSEQMEPVLERLNRFPEKTFVEFLNLAGIQPLQASPAVALLEFGVSDSSPQSVFVSRGFQVGAQAADGTSDLVIFETERDLNAAPAKIKELHSQVDNLFQTIDSAGDAAVFSPFGDHPEPGAALLIGIESNVTPAPTISIGIRVASPAGAPPPLPSGGVAPLPVAPGPRLEWSILDGDNFVPVEIVIDETGGLIHSGVVELQLPRRSRVGRPAGLEGKSLLRWLRLEIASGSFAEEPLLTSIKLNMVRALAARSIFNEALEPLPKSRNRQMTLSQKPILSDSLIIEVEEGGFASTEPEVDIQTNVDELLDTGELKSKTRRWRQVPDLAPYGPDDEVYTLDPLEGIVTFGDGVHGTEVPQGFRNVRAPIYRVGGGRAGAVEADAISTLLSSVAFITKVTNPWPATGGVDREKRQQAFKRGPQEIRARGRAVTVADYALLAQRAPGALIERAHAVAGLHPAYPGSPIPGVVGVFVVPPDRNEGPPTPDEDTLRAVADFLSEKAAPAGVEVVAAATKFHRVKIEAAITVRDGFDAGKVVRDSLRALDEFLHPLRGGGDGSGWPFGGTLQYQALIRCLTNVSGVGAVPTLNVIADGSRSLACKDFYPEPYALLWPEIHQIVIQDRKEVA